MNVTTAASWLQPPAVSVYLFSCRLSAGLLLPALILVVVLVNVTTAASWLQLPAVSILPAVWLNQAVLPGKTTAVVINCVRGDNSFFNKIICAVSGNALVLINKIYVFLNQNKFLPTTVLNQFC